MSAQIDEQYRFGSYTGPLEPSPPHADENPARAVIISWDDWPVRFIFWHEASYVPFWELPSGAGLTYQFFEGAHGSGELFNAPGRQEANSHVQILEAGPERVHVLWEYFDVNMDTGERVLHGLEDFFAYPNGLIWRTQRYESIEGGYSFEPMEMMILNPVGSYWWDHVPARNGKCKVCTWLDAFTQATREVFWEGGNLTDAPATVSGADLADINAAAGIVARVHMDGPDPFAIFGQATGLGECQLLELGDTGRKWGDTHFDHWPVGWLNSEGKVAIEDSLQTYPTHTCILGVDLPDSASSAGKDYVWLLGASDADNDSLRQLAREWLSHPEGCKHPGSAATLRAQ